MTENDASDDKMIPPGSIAGLDALAVETGGDGPVTQPFLPQSHDEADILDFQWVCDKASA